MISTDSRIKSGSAEECFHDFLSAHEKGSKLRELFVRFMGVHGSTAKHWLGGRMPAGENRLRLRFFLELMGYKVHELEKMNATVYDFAKLITYGIIELDYAAGKLGYSRDGMMRIILGKAGVSGDKLTQMRQLISEHQKEVEAENDRWTKSLNVNGKVTRPAPALVQSNGAVRAVAEAMTNKDVLISLAHMLNAMASIATPLSVAVNSNKFSADERAELRRLVAGGVFPLSTVLNQLCSETNRQLRLQSSHKPQDEREQ